MYSSTQSEVSSTSAKSPSRFGIAGYRGSTSVFLDYFSVSNVMVPGLLSPSSVRTYGLSCVSDTYGAQTLFFSSYSFGATDTSLVTLVSSSTEFG